MQLISPPLLSVLCLCNLPPKENKKLKLKQQTKQNIENIFHGSCSVTRYVSQCTLWSILLYLQMFEDSAFCYQYWILTWIPLVYPVVARCHGDLVASDLQDL